MLEGRGLIREVNERMAEIAEEMLFGEPLVLFCECSRPGCTRRVTVEAAQFAGVRAVPGRFVVAEGHEAAGQRVIERGPGFLIVEDEAPG
jgi:hypothetical protein